VNILIKDAQIVTRQGVFLGSVLIEDDKIADIYRDGEVVDLDDHIKIIDANGKYLLPGVIDTHVHFRFPGGEEKEDWNTGSQAALMGGVTTVMDMPNTPVSTVNMDLVADKKHNAEKHSLVNFGIYIGATKDNLDELKLAHSPAIKVYLGSTTGELLMDDYEIFETICSEVKDKVIVVHSESQSCMDRLKNELVNDTSANLHSKLRDRECAVESTEKVLEIAAKVDSRIHLAHVSTKDEVDMILEANLDNVSFEVAPHHLFFDESFYKERGNFVKVNPPVRTNLDRMKLWKIVAREGLNMTIATDHAPHRISEKEAEYSHAPSGLPGVQEVLPLMLDAVSHSKISIERLVDVMSYRPAKIFGLKKRGVIEKDYYADLVLVDLDLEQEFTKEMVKSKAGWSAYEGMKLKGWPIMTMVNGEIMMQDGELVNKTKGKEVEFGL